jgi:hypothetical protein
MVSAVNCLAFKFFCGEMFALRRIASAANCLCDELPCGELFAVNLLCGELPYFKKKLR